MCDILEKLADTQPFPEIVEAWHLIKAMNSDGVGCPSITIVEHEVDEVICPGDYFLFLNPQATVGDISVALDFAPAAIYAENPDDDWTYRFNAGGTESSPEQLSRGIAELYRYRAESE